MSGSARNCFRPRAPNSSISSIFLHNCIYDTVWRDSRRRHVEQLPLVELIRTYDRNYKLVLVGDAGVSPYEIDRPGGSVER